MDGERQRMGEQGPGRIANGPRNIFQDGLLEAVHRYGRGGDANMLRGEVNGGRGREEMVWAVFPDAVLCPPPFAT